MPGAPGPLGYGDVCSSDGLRLTLAFEFDLAGDDELPPKSPLLPRLLRAFWPDKFVELFDLLEGFPFGVAVFAGVTGGEASGTGGSGCWFLLRSRASISSRDKFTFVLPFAFARDILSNAD